MGEQHWSNFGNSNQDKEPKSHSHGHDRNQNDVRAVDGSKATSWFNVDRREEHFNSEEDRPSRLLSARGDQNDDTERIHNAGWDSSSSYSDEDVVETITIMTTVLMPMN